MTQLESARKGVITPEMIRVAVRENVTPEFVRADRKGDVGIECLLHRGSLTSDAAA